VGVCTDSNLVDFTFVDNAAHAFVLAAQRMDDTSVSGNAYFITNGDPVPFWVFARAAMEGMGMKVGDYLQDRVDFTVHCCCSPYAF